jgi:hypothetical protein
MDMNSLHVHAPASFLFVCGGPSDVTSEIPKSLRDAFLRVHAKGLFGDKDAIVAEGVQIFAPHGPYGDFLEFEADLAQISDVVVLFSEGSGSFSELGAFAIVKEIAERLIVVIDDRHYNEDSFIRLGPILSLSNRFGDGAVYVLNLKDINASNILNLAGLDEKAFGSLMNDIVKGRQLSVSNPTSFDRSNYAHLVKFIVGLVQHYRVLTFDEIDTIMFCLDLGEFRPKLDRLLFCAQQAGWIHHQRRGFNKYYSPIREKRALYYNLKPETKVIGRERWLAQITDFWRKSDLARFNIIQEAVTRGAS